MQSQSAVKKSRKHHQKKHRRQQSVYEELSCMTKSKLGQLLLTVAENELDIEQIRQQLANLNDFEPYVCFTRIDRNGQGYINGKDLSNFIKQNEGKHFLESECNYLIKYFDSEQSGYLNYQDFMQVVLPCDDHYLRAAATQRQAYKTLSYQYLSQQVEKTLSQLLQREIEFHIELENLKRDLEACIDYNCRQAFKAIDETNFGFINTQNLKVFLRKMGHQVLNKELIAIVRRFDLDGDSKITYQDFYEGLLLVSPEIIPLSNKQRVYGSPLRAMKKDSSQHNISQFHDQQRSSNKKHSGQTQEQDNLNRSVTFNEQIRVREYNQDDQSVRLPLQEETSQKQQTSILQTPQMSQSLDISKSTPLRPSPANKERFKDSSKKEFQNRQTLEYSIQKEQEIKQDLIRLFIDQIYLEREIDRFKQEFINFHDFSCSEAFKLFDYHQKGYLTIQDLIDSITRLIGEVDSKDIHLLFKRYDKDFDNKLSYSEFAQLFIPIDIYLSQKIRSQSSYLMSQQTMECIRRLIKAHLNIEKAHEYLRIRFNKQLQLMKSTYQEAFKLLTNQDCLTDQDLFILLSQNKSMSDLNKDIQLLMSQYNTKEKKITYNDFLEQLTPRLV